MYSFSYSNSLGPYYIYDLLEVMSTNLIKTILVIEENNMTKKKA